ncbi:MAG: GAF domain-containing protein [Bacteroidales bacterium]|nr:GAF domain-containing protein [Bacteroidales bacterium]MBN2758831.1 GAF domain-containing protein [Bacteroidales bacterium]
MKNIGLKITIIILIVIQLAFSLKSVFILKSVFEKLLKTVDIPQNQKMLLFSTLVFSIIISVVLIIIIFQLLKSNQRNQTIDLSDDDDKKAKTIIQMEKSAEKAKQLEINKEKREAVNILLKNLDTEKREKEFFEKLLSNLAEKYKIVQGIVFVKDKSDNVYKKAGTYAFYSEEEVREFKEEIGISGQVAANRELLNISDLPNKYITVLSGLGSSSPNHLVIFPILFKNKTIGIIEIATFTKINKFNEEVLMNFAEILGELVETFR